MILRENADNFAGSQQCARFVQRPHDAAQPRGSVDDDGAGPAENMTDAKTVRVGSEDDTANTAPCGQVQPDPVQMRDPIADKQSWSGRGQMFVAVQAQPINAVTEKPQAKAKSAIGKQP